VQCETQRADPRQTTAVLLVSKAENVKNHCSAPQYEYSEKIWER